MNPVRITEDHEWIRMEAGDIGVVGITEFAQDQLGDIVFIELPEVGRKVKQGQDVAVIESVKAAAECKAPVSGTVTEVNTALADDPAAVNRDPLAAGWFFKLKLDDPKQLEGLMDEATYKSRIEK